MHLVYYQPSGLYKPKTPIFLCFIIFVWSSIIGLFGGWVFTERALFPEFNINFFIVYFLVLLMISIPVTKITIKKLKIRNPEVAFKAGLISASLGWIFFYLTIRYIVLREIDSNFLEVIYARIKDGYPAYLEDGGSVYTYTVKGSMAIIMLGLELCVLPFFIAYMLKQHAASPFSEKTGSWYKLFIAPYIINQPSIKETSKNLKQGDTNWLLTIRAEKYRKLSSWSLEKVFLFIPEVDGDDCCYLATRGFLCRLIKSDDKYKEIQSYLKIDYQTAQTMMHRFGFYTDKKFVNFVKKLKIGGDGETNQTLPNKP